MASQSRAVETRQKLLEAAAELFAANGYLETTPKNIAEAAGLTTGALYYHFKSKEDIADAIIEQGSADISQTLAGSLDTPGSGIEKVLAVEFATVDLVNRDPLQRVKFHLGMSLGGHSSSAREAYRDRMEAFSTAVAVAMHDSELRDGVTRKNAGELLWIASTGAQLMSDALEETGAALFDRLAMALKTALRTIVPDEMIVRLEEFVDQAAAQYGRADAAGRVA